MLDEYYTFSSETYEHAIQIAVYDDFILEAEEYIFLYIPSLRLMNDVLLVAETSPSHVRIVIQDDEGRIELLIKDWHNSRHKRDALYEFFVAVATVGFKNVGDIMLQEGGGSERVCVGFDSAMENVTIDSEVYFILEIDSKASFPGSGHGNVYTGTFCESSSLVQISFEDLNFQPSSSSLYVDKYGHEDCIHLSSAYDTNVNDSHYTLTFDIRYTTISSVEINQQHASIDVYVTDVHGNGHVSESV